MNNENLILQLAGFLQDMPSKSGLPLGPSILATLCLFLVIVLVSSITNHKPIPQMQHSKIKRSVKGNPTDPDSTRTLSGIAPIEMRHLELAVRASIREAEAFGKMEDTEMVAILQNTNQVNDDLGLPGFDPEQTSPEELRAYFQESLDLFGSLLDKLQAAPGIMFRVVRGITPGEYERLVTATQTALRESIVYCQLSPENFREGVRHLQELYKGWGLDPWDHYNPYLDQFPQFFQERGEVLVAILERINQPYPGVEYATDISKTNPLVK